MERPQDIIGIGVNLAHRSFQRDRKHVIERAFAAGVQTMIITGTSLKGSQEGLRIAKEYPGQLFATAGVHPHYSRSCTERTIPDLRHLAEQREIVAIGECAGLQSRFLASAPAGEMV
jgi:TatD DNase family protein